MKIIISAIITCLVFNGLVIFCYVIKTWDKDIKFLKLLLDVTTDSNFWTAFGALNTFFAIFFVLVIPKWVEISEQPKIKVSLYKKVPPYVRIIKPTGKSEEESILFLTISVENKGETTAENAKIFITNAATYNDNKWNLYPDWAPAPLFLIRGQMGNPLLNNQNIAVTNNMLTGLDRGFYEDFDIFPNRPYLFDLGAFNYTEKNRDNFVILYSEMFHNQKEAYENKKKHCFEISIYAKNIKPKIVYAIIEWAGEHSVMENEISQRLKVQLKEKQPW